MGKSISRSCQLKEKSIGKFPLFLICTYFFITFFEPYLNGILGSVTKYYMFVVILVLLFKSKLRFKDYQLWFMAWLMYKIMTLLWTTNMTIPSVHFLSQVGMVLLLYALTNVKLSKADLDKIVMTMWFSSATIGILSLFFSHPYHGEFVTRQVLLLFGQETDPNNQAAFLVVGITISLYYILIKHKLKLISFLVLAVNTFTTFMTGSRGGLITIVVLIVAFCFIHENNFSMKKSLYRIGLLFVAAIVIYYISKAYLPSNIYNRLFDFSSYEGGSERSYIWRNTWDLISQGFHPIFGAGWGAFFGYNGMHSAVHNTYLAMLCDVGMIGMLMFFVPIMKSAFYLLRKKEVLPILLLICGFLPSFFLDAINKRFFWNVIQLLFMYYNYQRMFSAKENYRGSSYEN